MARTLIGKLKIGGGLLGGLVAGHILASSVTNNVGKIIKDPSLVPYVAPAEQPNESITPKNYSKSPRYVTTIE
jgi:hypothetical protein